MTGRDTDCDGEVYEAAVAMIFAEQCLQQSGAPESPAEMTGREQEALESLLAEIDVGMDRFDAEAGWGGELDRYDLVMMSKCSWAWQESNGALVDAMIEAREAGASTFAFGDDLAYRGGRVADFSQLILMNPPDNNGTRGASMVRFTSGAHDLMGGAFGTPRDSLYARDVDITTPLDEGEEVLAWREEGKSPVWAVREHEDGTRAAASVSSIDTNNHVTLDSAAADETAIVLLNTVAWLLE